MTTSTDNTRRRVGRRILNSMKPKPIWLPTLILVAYGGFQHAHSFHPGGSIVGPLPRCRSTTDCDVTRRRTVTLRVSQRPNGNDNDARGESGIMTPKTAPNRRPVRCHVPSKGDENGNDKNNDKDISANGRIPVRNATSRRDALRTAGAAVGIALLSSSSLPGVSSAFANGGNTSTKNLENLNLGVGRWTEQKDFKGQRQYKQDGMGQDLIIPPAFATYATRLLIRYDEGAASWWQGRLDAYSLLATDGANNKLRNDFGAMARSVQMALEDYVSLQQTDNADDINNNLTIQAKFADLANIFINSYATKNRQTAINDNILRQIGILFTTLPPEYQPLQVLNKLSSTAPPNTTEINIGGTGFVDQLTKLLPSEYKCAFDTASNSYAITPSVGLHEFGLDDDFGENVIATMFGPLSSTPLKRQRPNLSPSIYALFGVSGAAGCAITHSLVIPFDVVKTRLQTNPDRYSNVIDGAVTIAKNEGMGAFSLGGEATIAGYCWYGLTVYPSYAFFKWYLENYLLTSAYAAAHTNDIALIAGALAAVVASIGLTPMEACRIRTVAEPETYRDIGLVGTLGVISSENPVLGWKGLYAGFSSLLVRQVSFGSVKFLAFERACDAIYRSFPELHGVTYAALGVSLAGGAFSGALSSVVSQPADSVLTYVSKNSREGAGDMGIVESAQLMVRNEGAGSLFRGLGSRCLWASMIISGQFCLYDIFRNFFGINSEDLVQIFQVLINSQSLAIS